MDSLFQAGTIIGLLDGVYDGDINFKTLAEHGDIGLGTTNGVDGEMIAVDGKFYRADVNGATSIINPGTLTPFSVVTHFKPTQSFTIENIANMTVLNQLLDQHLPTENIFYMIRIDADISWAKLRSEGCQPTPYKPLAKTLPALQKIFELTNIKGTFVVTKCPAYTSGVTITDYHYHFINDNKNIGGHVFDLKIKTATVRIMPIRRFKMVLFNTKAFDEAKLTADPEMALKKTE